MEGVRVQSMGEEQPGPAQPCTMANSGDRRNKGRNATVESKSTGQQRMKEGARERSRGCWCERSSAVCGRMFDGEMNKDKRRR